MSDKSKTHPAFHPICFAAFPIVSLMAANLSMASIDDLWLPLGFVIGATGIIWLIFWLATRGVEKSALIASCIAFSFLIYGHVLRSFMLFTGNVPDLTVFFCIYFALMIASVAALLKIPSSFKLADLTFVLNVTSFALLVLPISQIIEWNQPTTASTKRESVAASAKSNGVTDKPDIYYIILDGMERLDLLKSVFDVDTTEFQNFLHERGFYLADRSHSNYPYTVLSMSSSLNMQYVNWITDGQNRPDWHPLFALIRDNEVIKFLKSQGYRYIHLDSSWFVTRDNSLADEVHRLTWSNSFISTAAALTPIGIHANWFHPIHDELRRHRLQLLDETVDIASKSSPAPRFVFVHALIPHMPFLFGANGEPINGSLNMHPKEWTDKAGYANQVRFLLKRLQSTLKAIQANSKKPPVIIVQGDHGAGCTAEFDTENPSMEFLTERFSILNAYYFPGKTKTALYDSVTPVNSFRILFNEYFGAQLPLLPDKSYFSPFEGAFRLRDVTDKLSEAASPKPVSPQANEQKP